LKAVGDQVAAFSSGLAELKESLKALTTPPPPDPVADPTADEITTSLLLDPKKFVSEETKGLQAAQIQTQAQLQEMRARQNPKFSGVFSKYGDELVAAAEKMPLAQRAQPGFWDWHTRTFIGDKMITGKIDQGSYPSLIGSSTIGVGEGGKESDPNKGF